MKWNLKRGTRKIHKWGSIIISIPLLIVLLSGLLLQVKKESDWIQPPTIEGTSSNPEISFQQILITAITIPEAEIKSWADIDRLDVRPEKGVVKVRSKNHWEIQIDTKTAKVLHTQYRRSDIIESLHDGSWFHEHVKLWVFLPSGVILTVLWISGVYLFFVPYINKWQNSRYSKKS